MAGMRDCDCHGILQHDPEEPSRGPWLWVSACGGPSDQEIPHRRGIHAKPLAETLQGPALVMQPGDLGAQRLIEAAHPHGHAATVQMFTDGLPGDAE